MKITILDSGFVSYDTIKPVGYAGEVNSRKIEVIHPNFPECYYQILVKCNSSLYKIGVQDSEAMIPPSLLRVAGKLECQFVAFNIPESSVNAETDTFVFKSNAFTLTVAEGMNLGGLSPMPTYEELQQMQRDIDAAKAEVDKAKQDNERILASIKESLDARQQVNQAGLDQMFIAKYKKQLDDITNEYFDDFVDNVVDDVVARIAEEYPPTPCPYLENGGCNKGEESNTPCPEPVIDEAKLKQLIAQVIRESASKTISSKPSHSMSQKGDIIGG